MKQRIEPTDAEIEAIVAEAIAAEASQARREASPPSSAIVWWRAQMRARQEATKAVERPLTIAHGLALAAFVGLAASVAGTLAAGFRGSAGWLASAYASVTGLIPTVASIDLTSRWVTLPMTAMLATLVIVSIAALVIFADE